MIIFNIIQQLILKITNLLVILSIIGFLSIMLITDSHFKSYTNFFENNNYILLIITPIYAQNNDDDFEYGNIFPNFEDDDDYLSDFGYGIIFPNFEGEDSSGDIDRDRKDDDDGSSGGSSRIDDDDDGTGEGGNEELINENTNDFSPLSSNSPTINDKTNPDEGIGQLEGKQIDESLNQTVGNEINQTVEQQQQQQDIGQQLEQQITVDNEVN